MRGNRMNTNFSSTSDWTERLIAALSYFSLSSFGFIWLIFCLITGKPLKSFLKFHIFQSFFITILYSILTKVSELLVPFVKIIPLIGNLVMGLLFYTTQMQLIFGFSLLHFGIIVIIAYLIVTALQGKYSELPWVSNIIKQLV